QSEPYRSTETTSMTKRRGICFVLVAILYGLHRWSLPTSANEGRKSEEITIYRDDFGIPNIFASTEEDAAYGMGYAQAEDRLEEVLKQYRRAEGTMAEFFGPEHVKHDYRQRVWQHRAISEAHYAELSPKVRAITEAYQAGIQQYMNEHPS